MGCLLLLLLLALVAAVQQPAHTRTSIVSPQSAHMESSKGTLLSWTALEPAGAPDGCL